MNRCYRVQDVISFASRVGLSLGMGDREAEEFARSLVYADMRGLHSHGLMRMPVYVQRIRQGLVSVGGGVRILHDGGALLSIDGQNGIGACAAMRAMELCVERASSLGMCTAAVCRSNHFGYSAFFTRFAAEHHMIGFAMSNAFRSVAPFGGASAMLGTNPLSIAIPAWPREPFLLDMATSSAAQGKIILAEKEKHQIPLGWGLDRDGRPTADPGAVLNGGTLTPFGGAKGYGIALMIELLCVCLARGEKSVSMGSLYDFSRTQGTGFIVGAVDVSHLMDPSEFERAAAQLLEEMKASPRSRDAAEILIPGEPEDRCFHAAEQEGIELPEAVIAELDAVGEAAGVSFPQAYNRRS